MDNPQTPSTSTSCLTITPDSQTQVTSKPAGFSQIEGIFPTSIQECLYKNGILSLLSTGEQINLKDTSSALSNTNFCVKLGNLLQAANSGTSGRFYYEVTCILNELGLTLAERGAFSESYKCFEKSKQIASQYLASDCSCLVSSFNNFAHLSYLKGEYAQALKLYNEALEILEGRSSRVPFACLENIGEKSSLLQFSDVYYGLGNVYMTLGKYSDAQKYLEDALEIRVKLFSEKHQKIAEIYKALGRLCLLTGSYDDALSFIKKGQAIISSVYGSQHFEMAKGASDLAVALVRLSKYDEAVAIVKKELDLLIKAYGEDCPEVAKSYSALGLVLKVQGNFSEARKSYLKSLEIKKKVYGESHEATGESYGEIADTYLMQGLYTEAEDYCYRFYEIVLKAFGKEHPRTALAGAYVKAVYIYLNKQTLAESENMEILFNELENIQGIQRACLGHEHLDLCMTYVIRGNAFRYIKNFADALECYNQALKIASKKKDYYLSAYIHRYLAFTYKAYGNLSLSLYHSNTGLKLWTRLPASARSQAFADPDFFAHVIFNLNDIVSAQKYMKKTQQLLSASKDEDWLSFAKTALKAFEKKAVKNKVMCDELF